MSDLIERHRDARRLNRIMDRELSEVRNHINSPAHSIWVTVASKFLASAALELYPELREPVERDGE